MVEDLRPYVCTFQTCDVKLFGDRKTWFEHEVQVHRLQWRCPFCSHECHSSEEAFQTHLKSRHREAFFTGSLKSLAQASRQAQEYFPAISCPFCAEWEESLRKSNAQIHEDETLVVTTRQFRNHVAQHMEQLALFAIPRGHNETEEADSGEVAAGSAVDVSIASNTLSQDSHVSSAPDCSLEELQTCLADGNFDEALQTIGTMRENGRDYTSLELEKILETAVEGPEPERATIVSELLEWGVDPNIRSPEGNTCLSLAAMHSNGDVIQRLLGFGADVNTKNKDGKTPLHHAYGSKSITETLLKYGSDLEAQDNHMRTPLHRASLSATLPVVRLLVDNGASVSARDVRRRTPLHVAALGCNLPIVKYLIERGSSVSAKDTDLDTPLHMVLRADEPLSLTALLLEYGAEINCNNGRQQTPLYLAVALGSLAKVNLLLDHGADADILDDTGFPLLYNAIRMKRHDIVRSLCIHGANPNRLGADGSTPLMRAAAIDAVDVVNVLLEFGATFKAWPDIVSPASAPSALSAMENLVRIFDARSQHEEAEEVQRALDENKAKFHNFPFLSVVGNLAESGYESAHESESEVDQMLLRLRRMKSHPTSKQSEGDLEAEEGSTSGSENLNLGPVASSGKSKEKKALDADIEDPQTQKAVDLWAALEAEPDTYVMSREEYQVFCKMISRWASVRNLDEKLARAAKGRYLQSLEENTGLKSERTENSQEENAFWTTDQTSTGESYYCNFQKEVYTKYSGDHSVLRLQHPKILIISMGLDHLARSNIEKAFPHCEVSYSVSRFIIAYTHALAFSFGVLT